MRAKNVESCLSIKTLGKDYEYTMDDEKQATPKAKSMKTKTDMFVNAPRSLKQGSTKDKYDEKCNNEVLNTCCSEFNALLFLTPPKIRSTGGIPTPSPLKQENPPFDLMMDSVLSKTMMDFLEQEEEGMDKNPPTHLPLQNITNRSNVIVNDKSEDLQKSEKPQFKFPDGGWVCLACKNYNFCGRVKCNRCGKNKTKDDPVGKPKHLLKRENDENDPPTHTKSASSHKKNLKERAGDWVCVSCRNINFAFRKECNRCKLGKELSAGGVPQYTPTEIAWNYSCFQQNPPNATRMYQAINPSNGMAEYYQYPFAYDKSVEGEIKYIPQQYPSYSSGISGM